MYKTIYILLFLTFIACNNKENIHEHKPSLLGLWNVQYISETDFDINDNDTLRGTFKDTLQNVTISFKKDSIIYAENNIDTIINKYVYHKINDSVLYVQNIVSKDSMKLYIHYLDTTRLLFTNIRLDEKREERYEVTMDCNKN
ncbi:MAG: hypothetical protein KF781_01505 [Chitinophagaceae bacterium]|nr:hypothetical protein [Chitinophagaceae bacterium]MCW5905411.1 hypothetical protein [Chitinophagaceae bacterium]